MIDQCQLWLPDAQKTRFCGKSLAQTLYGPADVYLTGDLGAGKTTFLDGFSEGLGILEHSKSPTYALENRYSIEKYDEYIHIDLYRLSSAEAIELLQSSDAHQGIRCIEWANRLPEVPQEGIHIHLEEKDGGRLVTVRFYDATIPSDEKIREWREYVALPEHIARHCDAVAAMTRECSQLLENEGYIIRQNALYAAARLHDLLRFIDFRNGGAHSPDQDPETAPAIWQQIREEFTGQKHEEACTNFLRKQKYPLVGEIIRHHGLQLPPGNLSTIEQKILYYSDKRMIVDKRATVQERFADFVQRYGNGVETEECKIWREEVLRAEQELFGLHPPR